MRCGFAVAFVAGVVCVAARADVKEDVGNGAKAWAVAMMAGDVEAVKSHSVGTEEEVARWQGVSKMIGAMKKLDEAARAKFGEEQGAMFGRFNRSPDFAQLSKDAKIEVNGDEATVTGKDGKPLKMRKDGGEWKVALSSLTDNMKMDPKQIAAMTAAVSSTADEIKEGKYGTAQEAAIAMGRKMQAAGAGGPPGGRPGAGRPRGN